MAPKRVLKVVIVGGGICVYAVSSFGGRKQADLGLFPRYPSRLSPNLPSFSCSFSTSPLIQSHPSLTVEPQPESPKPSDCKKRLARKSTSPFTSAKQKSEEYGVTRLGRGLRELADSARLGGRGLLTFEAGSVDVPIHLYCLYSHLNPDFSSKWAGRDEVLGCEYPLFP